MSGDGQFFLNHCILPLGAALWSCVEESFPSFLARVFGEFLENHRKPDPVGMTSE
jgi:predicted NAD/FAD-binding protein